MIKKILLATIAATISSQAAIVVQWNFGVFTGVRNDWPSQSASAPGIQNWSSSWTGYTNPGYLMDSATETSTILSGVTVGDMLGTSNNPGNGLFEDGLGYVVAASDGTLNLGGWDGNGTGAGVSNWLYFSLAPSPFNNLVLESITLTGWRNGAGGPSTFAFDYSTNNGASWNAFGSTVLVTGTGSGSSAQRTFTPSSPLTFDSAVLVRFAPNGSVSGTTGNIHISELTVNGSLVPEPTTGVLAGFGLLALLRRRR